VNDVSGGNMDEHMIDTVAKLAVPYVCMHMLGTPETMQHNPVYTDITKEITDYFIKKTTLCQLAGINDVIVDPGFGFGKTIQHNFTLLNKMNSLNILNRPIMVGLSRKSTIYKTLGITPGDSLNGTTVLNTLALNNGASILRVHDVKEAAEAIKLFSAYKNAARETDGI
jgi:dihydropteroate synthase